MSENQGNPASPEPSTEDTSVAIAAGLYYLYRLVGCPYGDNYTGFQAWIKASVLEPFREVCDRHVADSQHGVTNMTCDHCGHEWVAVHPVDTYALECPECHQYSQI